MTYRSIVVHLDTSELAHPRLELALRLAKQFDAHLSGLFAIYTPDSRAFNVVAGTADYYAGQQALRDERRAALERLFHAELSRANVAGEWLSANENANLAVPRRARCADLIVAGQDDPQDPDAYVAEHFQENLVMSAGRPVLLVPYAGTFPSLGQHVMAAWDGSREATRAIHDALPFMQRARRTTIVTVNSPYGEPLGSQVHGSEIAAVIERHGVTVETSQVDVAAGASIGDALLSYAADLGCDLLVMGGYAHARWRELVMGGATRTILRAMTLPVLMSH